MALKTKVQCKCGKEVELNSKEYILNASTGKKQYTFTCKNCGQKYIENE